MTATFTASPMSIRLDTLARERLKQIAQRQKRSAHALATEAIQALIEREEQEYAFNKSCTDSYNHFLETGLYVTQGAIDTWIDSLGTDQEVTLPPCHR